MTALNETAPLSAERLAEIRRNEAEVADYISSGLMSSTAAYRDRTDLLAEVDRLNKVVEFLGSQLQRGAMDVKDHLRLTAERDQAAEAAKHMGAALAKAGVAMQNAASTAVELGAHAGMDVIIGYLSDAGMLPESLLPDPQDGEKP